MVDLDDQRFRDVFDSLGGSAPDSHDGARDLLPSHRAGHAGADGWSDFGALAFVVLLATATALVLREHGHDRVIVVNTPTTSAASTTAPPRPTTTTTTRRRCRRVQRPPATPTAESPTARRRRAITDDTAVGPSGDAIEQRSAGTVDRRCSRPVPPARPARHRSAAGHDAIDAALDGAGDRKLDNGIRDV